MMRKESVAKGEHRPITGNGEQIRMVEDADQVLATGISSAGGVMSLKNKEQEAAETKAKLRAHLTSKAQLMQSYRDMDRMLSELEKEDDVEDGFVKERVTHEERKQWLEKWKKRSVKQDMAARKRDSAPAVEEAPVPKTPEEAVLLEEKQKAKVAEMNARTKAHLALGGTFGFWAEDRPHELRLDPDNMKVYSFSTFKLRYPYKHSWTVESQWKKLPKAPHKVKRNKQAGLLQTDGMPAASLLDEHDMPLIFIKDSRGFYHQGNVQLTEEEILKTQKPMEYRDFLMRQKEEAMNKESEKDKEKYKVYMNRTGQMSELIEQFKTGDKVDKENVREMMGHLRDDIAYDLNLDRKRHARGRADVSIKGMNGLLTGFLLYPNQVTGQKLKEKIQEKTGVPAEVQRLYYGLVELTNNETIDKAVPPGVDRTIEMIQDASAIAKKGKAPHKYFKPNDDTPQVINLKKEQQDLSEWAAKEKEQQMHAEAKSAKEKLAQDFPDEKEVPRTKSLSEEAIAKHGHKQHKSWNEEAPEHKEKMLEMLAESKSDEEEQSTPSGKHHQKHHGHHKHHKADDASLAEVDKKAQLKGDEFGDNYHAEESLLWHGPKPEAGMDALLKKRSAWTTTQAPTILRRTLYVREEDGTIHVEKQEVATPGHPILPESKYTAKHEWSVIDRGIPIDVLLEEDEGDDKKEQQKKEGSEAQPPALIQVAKQQGHHKGTTRPVAKKVAAKVTQGRARPAAWSKRYVTKNTYAKMRSMR